MDTTDAQIAAMQRELTALLQPTRGSRALAKKVTLEMLLVTFGMGVLERGTSLFIPDHLRDLYGVTFFFVCWLLIAVLYTQHIRKGGL